MDRREEGTKRWTSQPQRRRCYSDERGVYRVYEMSIGEGEWKLWREGAPFPQRFSATISDEGNTIAGRWEKAPEERTWETDFDLTYRKVG